MTSTTMTMGAYLRALRTSARLTQAELAAASGMRPGTIGNLESSGFRVVGRERIDNLIGALKLERARAARLLALWEAAPLSPFAEKRQRQWDAARERRRRESDNRAAAAELSVQRDQLVPIRAALILLLDVAATVERKCQCEPAQEIVCELCVGMRALGVAGGWVDSATAMRRLGEIQDADDEPELDFGGFGGY